jgi:Domain of unknown function (DUF1877)
MGMRARIREVQAGDVVRLDDREQALGVLGRNDPATLDLDKSWDGMHRLLTAAGTAPELGFLFTGGTEVGIQFTYGRPRLLDVGFVRRLDTALRGVSDDQFWAGYDADQFEADGVYPGIWDESADELRDEYVSYRREVRELVGRVATAGGEIVVAIL